MPTPLPSPADQSGAEWTDWSLILKLLAIDPIGLGGLTLRARSGPVRDRMVQDLNSLPLPTRKLHPGISDEQLFGGIDISSTLSGGQLVVSKGLLENSSTLVLTMAERCDAALAAKLAQHLDAGAQGPLIVLDEGAEDEEQAPAPLTDRLAFHLSPRGQLPKDHPPETGLKVTERTTAQHRLSQMTLDDATPEALITLALQFGIASLRTPTLALRCARAHAALMGRTQVDPKDIAVAATLVYAPRATQIPDLDPPQDDTPPEQPPETDPSDDDMDGPQADSLPDADMMVEAVKSLLPAGLIETLVPAGTTRGATGSGAGQKRKGNRRGRPLPSRAGRLDGQSRIDLVATLRAAAPWQPMRRAQQPDREGLLIRSSDIRLRRYEEKSDRVLIFAVDASGSAAVSRLSEAKGAIELLLSEAYARRDHVALISFRGTEAEILLPPTRSLVQTKRRLAGLPGGGGTPLAAGLKEAAELAVLSRAKGLSPTIVLLTDGRANIALDGTADRATAAQDSETLASTLRAQGIPSLVIDMSNRPQQALETLAGVLDAPYVALPRADAQKLSGAVTAALSEA
jgi:magnesium chelatase subunit D